MTSKNIIKNFIYYSLLILSILMLIGEILLINYALNNNFRFKTHFNLMFGYTAWGRDYAREIIKEEYKDKEVTYQCEPTHIYCEFNNIIEPYSVTIYNKTDEEIIIYIAYINTSTYTIEWEIINEYEEKD